ncbi:MAG: outer membrane protein assembly factor BamD [Candidatus Acidiferrales bacterium]
MNRISRSNPILLAAILSLVLPLSGCLFGGKKKNTVPTTGSSVEPDKVLYDRGMDDIKHSRYTVARLDLQTLINTYPDSEYLAKAKLAIGDSYFKEGGTAGLTQSVSEYKDFITFFPFLEEAAYAQMQVAMSHYQMMEKPDRDESQAQLAEDEFQTFLLKYPQSPLVPTAEQHLREVQEVIAEGDFRVAHFYYVRATPGGYKAAASRLIELTDRYPLYSQSDKALWMLGDIYGSQGRTEDEKAKMREWASKYYSRIVRDYPLSPLVPAAKQKLVAGGYPVPQPDATAVARMQKEQQIPRAHNSVLRVPLGIVRSMPDVSMAAHTGQPNLNPPSETGGDVMRPAGGNGMSVGGGGGGGGSNGVAVERVEAGSATTPPATTPSSSTTKAGDSSSTDPKAGSNPGTAPAPGSTDPSPSESSKAADSSKGSKDSKDATAKDKNESTSKKKKGLRKIIPW